MKYLAKWSSIRRNIPEDRNLHYHRCEKVISYKRGRGNSPTVVDTVGLKAVELYSAK
jgi:hypothetical protein